MTIHHIAKSNHRMIQSASKSIPAIGPGTQSMKQFTGDIVPDTFDYRHLVTERFTVAQLVKISRHHRLRTSGNKRTVINRLYTYLVMCEKAMKIQPIVRGFLVRTYNTMKGAALFDRTICCNKTDMISLEDISAIPYHEFMSFSDATGNIYGFEIGSIMNLFGANKRGNPASIPNPYTREPIDRAVFRTARRLVRMAPFFGGTVDIVFDGSVVGTRGVLDPAERYRSELNNVCAAMDSLGHYTSTTWFSGMTRVKMIRYLLALNDIWQYRAQLSDEMKNQICPPAGQPFPAQCIRTIDHQSESALRWHVLRTIENLVYRARTSEHRNLGAMWALTACTLVVPSAAESMPALYYSVA